MRVRRFCVALAVVMLGIVASPAGASVVVLHGPAASGRLHIAATSDAKNTFAALRGRLRARSALRFVVLRCEHVGCPRPVHRGRARKSIAPGRKRIDTRLRVRRTAAVRVDLRSEGRLLARRILIARAPTLPAGLPGMLPFHLGSGPVSDDGTVGSTIPPGDAPPPGGPTELALTLSPSLTPAFDPAVPDYTTRCNGQEVVFEGSVPADRVVTVDSGPPHSGTSFSQPVALQQGQAFRFTVNDGSGTHEYVVRCLPADFPSWTTELNGTPQAKFLVFSPSLGDGASRYAIVADARGVPVWWKEAVGAFPVDVKLLPDGSIAWARFSGTGSYGSSYYDHFSLDGTALEQISAVGIGTDHHELQVLANGDRLVQAYSARQHVDLTSLGGPADATVLDGVIQEVTPAGALVWSWNSKDHIATSETAPWGLAGTQVSTPDGPAYDLVHLNSLAEDGDGFVVSARHLDAIFRIRRSDSGIDWKLGGSQRPESLSFVNDPLAAQSFGGQHDARVLPDGTVSVHDNGTGRSRPPRVVRYAIDATARTATLVEQVQDPRAAVSGCCNSARRLEGGDWVVTNDGLRTVSELTPSGSPVLTLRFGAGFTYRAIPVTAAELPRQTLVAGMDAMYPR